MNYLQYNIMAKQKKVTRITQDPCDTEVMLTRKLTSYFLIYHLL